MVLRKKRCQEFHKWNWNTGFLLTAAAAVGCAYFFFIFSLSCCVLRIFQPRGILLNGLTVLLLGTNSRELLFRFLAVNSFWSCHVVKVATGSWFISGGGGKREGFRKGFALSFTNVWCFDFYEVCSTLVGVSFIIPFEIEVDLQHTYGFSVSIVG